MIPENVRAAAKGARERLPAISPARPKGKAGELGIADKSGTQGCSRLVAVISRDQATRTLVVHLATNVIEAASDFDLIVLPPDAGVPFGIMVQSELYGPIFVEQLERAVGNLANEQLEALSRALITDGESLKGFPTGPALGGSNDPRRDFKNRELEDLNELVDECRSWLAGSPAPNELLDPELLIPPARGTDPAMATDQFLELLDSMSALGTKTIPLPSGLLTLLGESGLLEEIFRWRTDFGLDTARILASFSIGESMGDLPEQLELESGSSDERRTDVVLNPFLVTQAQTGVRVIDIRSTGRCWSHNRELIVVTSSEGASCRARVRILEAA